MYTKIFKRCKFHKFYNSFMKDLLKTLLTCIALSVVKFINSSNELAVAYHIYKCNDVDPVVMCSPSDWKWESVTVQGVSTMEWYLKHDVYYILLI